MKIDITYFTTVTWIHVTDTAAPDTSVRSCALNSAKKLPILCWKNIATFVGSVPVSIVYFYINKELYISLCSTSGSINRTELLLTNEPIFIIIHRFKANNFLKRNFDWIQIQHCISIHNQLNWTQRKIFCFDAVSAKIAITYPENKNWHVIFWRVLFNISRKLILFRDVMVHGRKLKQQYLYEDIPLYSSN
jgi:hypothetical protein